VRIVVPYSLAIISHGNRRFFRATASSLGKAVSDPRVHLFTVNPHGFKLTGHLPEGGHLPPLHQGRHPFPYEEDILLRKKDWVTIDDTGILDGHTVPRGYLVVAQKKHNGNGLTGIAHPFMPLSHRITKIKKAVHLHAILDGVKIIEVKTAHAG